MSVYEALQLMIGFSGLMISFLLLVVAIITLNNKK